MRKAKLPNIVTILILTMVTTLMWVGFSIYRAFTTAPPPSVPKDVSATLSPSLDADTINKVESALFFSESQIPALTTGTATPAPTVAPTETPIPTETPAETAIPTETPVETPTESPIASPTP